MSCVSGAPDQSPLQPNPTHQMEPGMLRAPPEPIRTSSYSQQKANLAMSNIIAVPLNKLTRSARNVRKSGGESIDNLASSILVHGLFHNLTVVEQLAANGENCGRYEVVAGGRRFAALQRLAKKKKVPKTFAVPCLVVDPAVATEASLAENTIRVAMHPADQFIVFHDLVVQSGLSIDDVAARFGVSPLFVRQRLKLANVAPRFIAAYRAGDMQLDHSKPSPSPMITRPKNRPGTGLAMIGSEAPLSPVLAPRFIIFR
jgi:ParB/RepB/Spo0J family partition protein